MWVRPRGAAGAVGVVAREVRQRLRRAVAGPVEALEQRLMLTADPAGSEFRVNTTTLDVQQNPAVAMDAAGGFVVAWESYRQVGDDGLGIFARRFDAAGVP